jgi:pimeloyl-ACP methyl ester carboxylesterase
MLSRVENKRDTTLAEDVDAELGIDSAGRVSDVRMSRPSRPGVSWDSIAKQLADWRFEPARSSDGSPQPTIVRLHLRYRSERAVSADSVDAFREIAAQRGIDYAVLGHAIADYKTTWLSGNGVALHVLYGGPRRLRTDSTGISRASLPVIIVPTVGGRAEQWESVLQQLQDTRFALAYDLRGNGKSADREGHTIAEHARDLAALISSGTIGRSIIVGHGVGASIAAELARQHPELVAGLVLVAPAGDYTRAGPQPHSVLDSIRKVASDVSNVRPLQRYFALSDSLLLAKVASDIGLAQRSAVDKTVASATAYDCRCPRELSGADARTAASARADQRRSPPIWQRFPLPVAEARESRAPNECQ